jgi:hypothetical protein
MSDLIDTKINQTETPSTLSYELLNDYELSNNNNNNKYLNELAEEVVLKSISSLELPTNRKHEIIKKEDKISSSSQFSKTQSKKQTLLLNNINQQLNDHSLTFITSNCTKQSDNILSSSSYGSSIEQINIKRNDLIKKELESKLNIKNNNKEKNINKLALKSNSFISLLSNNCDFNKNKLIIKNNNDETSKKLNNNNNIELLNEYSRFKVRIIIIIIRRNKIYFFLI